MSAWQDQASCKGAPTDWFYPEGAEVNAEALYLCEKCPVIDECRDHGVIYEEWGIWGGLSASQRRRVRKEFNIVLSQSVSLRRAPYHANCGTNAGYHGLIRYYDNHPYDTRIKCQYCALAHKEYNREKILEEDKILRRRERDRKKYARRVSEKSPE
jgi:WhiB family redox-sensing transcriptional regulator